MVAADVTGVQLPSRVAVGGTSPDYGLPRIRCLYLLCLTLVVSSCGDPGQVGEEPGGAPPAFCPLPFTRFEPWIGSGPPPCRSLRRGYPSLEELRAIVSAGRSGYVEARVSATRTAIQSLSLDPALLVAVETWIDVVWADFAKEKWGVYAELHKQLEDLERQQRMAEVDSIQESEEPHMDFGRHAWRALCELRLGVIESAAERFRSLARDGASIERILTVLEHDE